MLPGDILYLPRGLYHSTIASIDPNSPNDYSIHFTVGIETETYAYTNQV